MELCSRVVEQTPFDYVTIRLPDDGAILPHLRPNCLTGIIAPHPSLSPIGI
jgi:hypothetical protein